MTKNTGNNFRRGSERKRGQFYNNHIKRFTRRNLNTGEFTNNSINKFKGVRKYRKK